MRRTAALVVVGLVVAALACGGGAVDEGEPEDVAEIVVEAPYGQPFDLGLGQGALVAGEFHVTFERVAEESRCPEGSQCAQAGNAAAAFAVESDAGRATLTLNTGRAAERAAAMGGELHLVELAPRPAADAVTDTSAYVATLIVSPAP